MHALRFISCLIGVTSVLSGQVFSPKQSSGSSGNSAQKSTSSAPQSGGKSEQSMFGNDVPLLNPGDETVTIGGLTIPLGDNRVIKARFEKYLNQPAETISEAEEYHAILDQIIDLLASRVGDTKSRQAKIAEAFSLLPIAASYKGDAKLCQTLAETVYASLQAKKDVNQMSRLNEALDEQSVKLGKRADWLKRSARSSSLGERRTLGSRKTVSDKEKGEVKTIASYEYLGLSKKIAEIEAMRKKHSVQSETQTLQTKIQFQATMMQWLMQRRFHHVIIAARFYNVLWQDGDNALYVDKDSTLSKLFSSSLGFSPTVTAIDGIANEAVRDTENAIDACEFLMENGDLHTASKRLLEAFAIGEFLTPVASLRREKKRVMQVYIRELSRLFDAIQARDYGRARELTIKLKADANDFPSSKAESAISANMIASNMAVSKAKKALLEENEEVVSDAIQRATEYWPTNPKIAEFAALLESGTQVSVLRNDFDRLLREQNFREIFKRRYEFQPVVAADPDNIDAFNQIVKNIGKIEGALGKAEEFVKIGNAYGAWEQLDQLREEFPDDQRLGRELEKLTPKVADFAKALDMARILEGRTPKQTGSAISYYLKAKSIYPSSEYAEEGLNKLINETIGN